MCGGNYPRVRCHQRGSAQYMCEICDAEVHKHHSLHDREIWSEGFFKPVPPTIVPTSLEDEQIQKQREIYIS